MQKKSLRDRLPSLVKDFVIMSFVNITPEMLTNLWIN
jgi:hypothetical protein